MNLNIQSLFRSGHKTLHSFKKMNLTIFVLMIISVVPSNCIRLSALEKPNEFRLLRQAIDDIVRGNNISELFILGSQKMFQDNVMDLMVILKNLNEEITHTFVNYGK